jgi:peptidoglycan/LPS O-acetylase OafA/YrhL
MQRNRTWYRTWYRAALAASGWLALAATALPDGSALRWIPVLAFVAFGPGLALLHPQPRGLRPGARLEALALAAPVSLSLATLTATALFLREGFSTTAFLIPLAAFATVVAALPGVPLPAATRGAAGRAGPDGPDR